MKNPRNYIERDRAPTRPETLENQQAADARLDHRTICKPRYNVCPTDRIAPVYGWFTEGFDTPDLKEAKALLEELA
jgi:hypothetical protein